MDVAGNLLESRPVGSPGLLEVARREMDVAELHSHPGNVLGHCQRELVGRRERLDRLRRAAEQLAGVSDSGVRGHARREHRHTVVRVKCLLVATECQKSISERSVGACVLGVLTDRASRQNQRVVEAMPRDCQRGKARRREGLGGPELERSSKRTL